MSYIDGFIVPLTMSRKMKKLWEDHGAVGYHEAIADDVKPGKWTSFPRVQVDHLTS